MKTIKEPKYIDLLSDAGFKIVFGEEGQQKLLIPLFKVIFPDIDIVGLEYIERESIPFTSSLKRPICDVRCRLSDGSEVIVEVQRVYQSQFFKRAFFESCLSYAGQLSIGMDYGELRPVYVVCLLDFEMEHETGKGHDIVYRYHFSEECTHECLFHDIRLAFVELGRFKKSLEELDSFDDKLYFCLRNMALMDDVPESLEGDYFRSLFNRSFFAGLPKDKKTIILENMLREWDIRDIKESALAQGRKEGLKEGVKEGLREAFSIIAEKMRAEGFSEEDILRLTSINIAEAEK